ncbi:MAG TPA: AbrB/MazE/SpoVT family DNA-binding domain-containing protein [Patescibacteria group bacterium]|nr:AbrB/MazE/SpoVT family DNA-binding domain-containing protein [Patescibacteria group bacterium]
MTQTIINIGNSQGVIFPKEILNKLKISKGDEVDIDFEDDGRIIISKKGSKKTKAKVSDELLVWLDGFNKRYKSALQELASK